MRYFELVNHLTVPRTLLPGIGNTHARPEPGHVIAISDEACARESRFVNGRVRAGDMKETTETAYLAFAKAQLEAENLAATKAQETATEAPAAKAAKGK